MDSTLRLLMRLWWVQKYRDFHWKDVFIAVYFATCYVVMVVALYFGLREQLAQMPVPFELPALVPALAVSVVPADLILKLFWRRPPVEMDDYLRTRPVGHRDWGLFILFDTMAGFMQWMLPLMTAFVVALIMPAGYALLTLVLCFSCTLVNALFQNCWRRAPGNQWTLPLVAGYIVWMVAAYAVAVTGFVVTGLAGDDPSTPVRPAAVAAGVLCTAGALLAANVVAAALLQWYFVRLHNHNEELHAPVHTSARSLGEVSVWSIEWVQLMRSKRLRVSFLTIVAVFLLNVYIQQMTTGTMQEDLHIPVNPMLLFGIGFPSIILAQWVLGIEANFFAGIWTRPWPVVGILRRKYVFFCGICVAMALLTAPAVLWMDLSPLAWMATLLFACGVFVLPFMATCLFSSRMDLFASAFFNYQGGNKQINFFSFVMFIPIIIYFGTYFLLPAKWAHLVIATLGVAGLLLHRWYINRIAALWFRRRYQIMERWLTE